MKRGKKIDFERFYAGCIELWKCYKETGRMKIKQDIQVKYSMPRCKVSLYDPIFTEEEPIRANMYKLRRKISRYERSRKQRNKNAEGFLSYMKDMEDNEMKIHEAIDLLKANGYRIIKRVVVEEEV